MKILGFFSVTFFIFSLSFRAFSDHHETTETEEVTKKFGLQFDYDVSANYTDTKQADMDSVKTTVISQTGYLGATFTPVPDIIGTVYFNLFGDSSDNDNKRTEVAMVTYKHSELFSFSGGKNYLNFGGRDNMNWNYATIAVSPYTDMMGPFSASAPMMSGTVAAGIGAFTLMITDDIKEVESKQPTALLEWNGSFGIFQPLLQLAPYNLGRSLQTSLSLGFDSNGYSGYLDVVVDARDANDNTTNYTNIVFELNYSGSSLSPFLKVATFDTKQPTKDLKGNSSADKYDDNGMVALLGTNFNGVSQYFAPYLAVVSQSKKDLKAGSIDDTETLTMTSLIFGVGGSL